MHSVPTAKHSCEFSLFKRFLLYWDFSIGRHFRLRYLFLVSEKYNDTLLEKNLQITSPNLTGIATSREPVWKTPNLIRVTLLSPYQILAELLSYIYYGAKLSYISRSLICPNL